jgi:hypothetical protein
LKEKFRVAVEKFRCRFLAGVDGKLAVKWIANNGGTSEQEPEQNSADSEALQAMFGFDGPFRLVLASRPGPPKLNDLEFSCYLRRP